MSVPGLTREKLIRLIKKAKESSRDRNFLESVDLTVVFKGLDMNKTTNRLSEIIELPNGRGKTPSVCVVATGDLALGAKRSGAVVLDPSEVKSIATNKRKAKETVQGCKFFLVQSDLMPMVGRELGRYMGPRGIKPIPIPPTGDVSQRVEKLRKSVSLTMRKEPILHVPVGSKDMEEERIAENIEAVMSFLASRYDLKHNLASIYIKTTMGNPIRVYPAGDGS